MLLVRTRLGASPIHGIGLFADEPIARGTVVWKYHPRIDLRLSAGEIEDLAEASREQMRRYSYRERSSGLYVLCGDDARFFNHSPAPNCIDLHDETSGDITVATRDIEPGEELTCDYALFDLDLVEGRYSLGEVAQVVPPPVPLAS